MTSDRCRLVAPYKLPAIQSQKKVATTASRRLHNSEGNDNHLVALQEKKADVYYSNNNLKLYKCDE